MWRIAASTTSNISFDGVHDPMKRYKLIDHDRIVNKIKNKLSLCYIIQRKKVYIQVIKEQWPCKGAGFPIQEYGFKTTGYRLILSFFQSKLNEQLELVGTE